MFDAAIATAPAVRTVVPQRMAGGRELGWPAVAQVLAEVSDGDTSTLDALAGAAASDSTVGDPSIAAGADGLYYGVLCADFGPQRDYAAFTAAAAAVRRGRRALPGGSGTRPTAHGTASAGTASAGPRSQLPATPPQVGAHPNVMVANPAYDPQPR